MKTPLPLVAVAVTVAAAGLLMACGPSKTSSSSTGANPSASSATQGKPTGAKPSCSRVPASLVNATLGTQVGEAKVQDLGVVVVCRYESTAGTGSVVVRFQSDMTATLFAQSRQISDASGLTTSDLPGFADDAYTNVIAVGSHVTNTVVARKGQLEILVSSPASFDAEKALEQQLFDSLS